MCRSERERGYALLGEHVVRATDILSSSCIVSVIVGKYAPGYTMLEGLEGEAREAKKRL